MSLRRQHTVASLRQNSALPIDDHSAKLIDARHKIGDEEFPEEVGPSGTEYQIEIHVTWDHQPGGDVRVMGTIDDGTFRGAFKPVCEDLIVTPD